MVAPLSAYYDVAEYGLADYGVVLTPPITGTGGGITVWYDLYRATLDNALVEDISGILTGGGVDLNHDRAITAQGVFDVRDAARIVPYTDYLAVFLNRSYDDGRPDERDQLGLFTTRVPPGTRTIERAEGSHTAHDMTAKLARYAFADVYNIAAGTNYVTAVTTIMALAGITRHAIPPDGRTLATPMTFGIGTTYLEACNILLEAIGYYQLSATPDGKLTSRPSMDIRYVEPVTTVTDDDLMSEMETQPTDSTVANIVIVVQDNFNAPPLTAVRRNDAADSPTSTVNLGPITRTERRSNLADQAAVDALADRLLSEGRTFYQTATLRLLPLPQLLQPHQTIDLELSGKLAIFSGRWWIRTVSMGFTPETAGPVLEINRVTDRITGALI